MIPLILGLGAAALGIGGHLSAKETNEMAQQTAESAKRMYDEAKQSLESAQAKTENALVKLGTSKKQIMYGSITQFLTAYDRIKDVQLTGSVGVEELSNFDIDQQGAIQLREMSDIYASSISSSAAGAATGALIALAASGSLPVVTGGLSLAGTALMLGDIGAAAGIAGSALSLGAALTPLSAIAAPVVLFTGISASMKADENLEKAQAMYAEANAACEKMAVAKTLCHGITERSDMFTELLEQLEQLYTPCTYLMDRVTAKKDRRAKGRPLSSKDFTEEELKLIAVTRSLTGAIKAVIDTPILTTDGNLSEEAQSVYDGTVKCLPELTAKAAEVQSCQYHISLFPGSAKIPQGGSRSPVGRNGTIWKILIAAILCIVVLASVRVFFFSQDSTAGKEKGLSSSQPMQNTGTTVKPSDDTNDVDPLENSVGEENLTTAETVSPLEEISALPEEAVPAQVEPETPLEESALAANPVQKEFELEKLVGAGYLRSLKLFFDIFEQDGIYYFNFVVSNGKDNHLNDPVPISVDGEYAFAEYADDNFGNSGIVWFSCDDDGMIYMSGRVDDPNMPKYTSSYDFSALIMDEEPMYYDDAVYNYPVYTEYLDHTYFDGYVDTPCPWTDMIAYSSTERNWGGIGDTVASNWLNLTVENVYAIQEYQEHQAFPGRQLIVVTVSVENIYSSPITFTKEDLSIFWNEGRSHGNSIQTLSGITLDIGETFSTELIYKVPVQMHNFAILLSDGKEGYAKTSIIGFSVDSLD